MSNRVRSDFRLTVLSIFILALGATGCSSGKGLRVGTTGGATSSTAGATGATGGSAGATVDITSTTGGSTSTIGPGGGAGTVTSQGTTGSTGGMDGGGATGTTGGLTSSTGGTGGSSGTGENKCTTDQNTCATDDDCTLSPYRPPISSPADCACFECGYPVTNAITGDCQSAYDQFCGPNWQKEHGCVPPPCAMFFGFVCIAGTCQYSSN
jgi:hypothetical protein